MTLRVRLEPLASSSAKLPAIAGAALANGSLHGLPVARSLAEIPRPVERHDPGQRALNVRSGDVHRIRERLLQIQRGQRHALRGRVDAPDAHLDVRRLT